MIRYLPWLAIACIWLTVLWVLFWTEPTPQRALLHPSPFTWVLAAAIMIVLVVTIGNRDDGKGA